MSLDTTEWLMDQGFPTSNDLLPSVYRPCDPQVTSIKVCKFARWWEIGGSTTCMSCCLRTLQVFPVPAAESVRTGFEVRNTEYVNSRATLLRQSAVPDTSLAVANVEQSKSSQQVFIATFLMMANLN